MDMNTSQTEARLEQTVQELQARVQQQQIALDKLRASTNLDLHNIAYASTDPRDKLKQLRRVKAAYARLKPIVPYLPLKESVLPALLAARSSQQTIHDTKDAIKSTQSQVEKRQSALRLEEANLHDANLLTTAMENRIKRLQSQHEERSQKTPAQLAKNLIEIKREKIVDYTDEFNRLSEGFHEFVTDYLSPMLAAEELGGPVVGDMPEVEESALAAGFTKKGKAKSTKKTPSDSLRQKRIDQIWGSKALNDGEQLGEADAADNEMRKLIEGLFATLNGPGGHGVYYELDRDSASSRFLVRAKIAQFHPRDARKMRLIDFGGELDD